MNTKDIAQAIRYYRHANNLTIEELEAKSGVKGINMIEQHGSITGSEIVDIIEVLNVHLGVFWNTVAEISEKNSKRAKNERERVLILGKEHLSKEDYERLAELEADNG